MTDLTTEEFAKARIKVILKEIKALRGELALLRGIKKGTAAAKNRAQDAPKRKRSGLTFQDMIVEVLREQPNNGADAQEILKLILDKFNKQIERSSISPQLSRLKDKGVLSLDDNVWSLTDEHKGP